MLLTELYELTYGIRPDVENESPLAPVSFHEANNTLRYSGLFSYVDRFERLKVGETYRLSLVEFLELPRDIADELLERALLRLREKGNSVDSIEAKLSEELRKLGG
jgi:hypothetical protein